jgi:hypothetical protein
MAEADFAINGKVRQILARRWIRPEPLEIGVTDGVVLIAGYLDLEPGGVKDAAQPETRARLIKRLRSEIGALPGVVDVVIDLHQSEERARRWSSLGG